MVLPPFPMDSQNALANWLLGWFAEAADEEKQVMIQAVYGLWVARNDARDGKKMASPHEIMESIYSHLIEWRQVHDAAARVPQARTVQRWKPPSQGWVKVNSDGVVAGNGEKGGAGVVIRDAGVLFLQVPVSSSIARLTRRLWKSSPAKVVYSLLLREDFKVSIWSWTACLLCKC